jgi:hypothetical protein
MRGITLTDYDERERVRFDVLPDGTVEGDDGADGHLAETLRYTCRMGSQIGALLELGELERVSTLSSLSVLARVAGVSPHVSIKVEVEAQKSSRPRVVAVSGVTVQDAIDQALRRVTIDLATDWAAIITDDGRLVGAVHDESMGQGASEHVLEVGVRALAVLGALDEALREIAVRLDFVRGSLLVAAIGEHALFALADKFDVSEVVRTVAGVQGLLAEVDLAHAYPVTASTRA